MKKLWKRVLLVMLTCMMMCGFFAQNTEAASKYSMKKVLSYYKKGKYSKAQKIANKLPKNASEKAVKKMSKKVKKAYLKKLKSYSTRSKKDKYGRYMQCYFLTDIDKDGVPELLVKYGSCEADMELHVYTYKKNKLKCITKTHANHDSYYAYPNGNGVIRYYTFQGWDEIQKLTLKNGKLKWTTIGGRWLWDYNNNGKQIGTFMNLPYALNSHTSYKNGKVVISYKDLK